MKKKSEENALDALLRRKLENLEEAPAPALWDRIEKRRKRPRKYIWYAAACMLAGMTGGTAVWLTNNDSSGAIKMVAGLPKEKLSEEKPISGGQVITAEAEPGQRGGELETRTKELPESINTDRRIAIEAPKTRVAEERQEITGVNAASTAPAHAETRETEPAVLVGKEIAAPVPVQREAFAAINELPKAVVQPGVNVPAEEPPTVLVVYVEPAPESGSEVKKKGAFQKVFRQLRRMKQGEEVDWEELGFNPKKVLARMDRELTEPDGALPREYRTLKEKTSF